MYSQSYDMGLLKPLEQSCQNKAAETTSLTHCIAASSKQQLSHEIKSA